MGIKSTFIGAALAAMALTGAASAATSVSVIANAPESWDEVDLLNTTGLSSGATWTTAPSTVMGSVSGSYKSPFDPRLADNGVDVAPADQIPNWQDIKFFSVGSVAPLVQSPAVLGLDATKYVLTILWGSVDLYNAIELYDGGSLVGTVSGSQIFAAGGEPAASGAAFVKISSTTGFDQVNFRSNFPSGGDDRPAFEFSNVVAAVPLPAGGLLLLTALGGLGLASRKLKSV